MSNQDSMIKLKNVSMSGNSKDKVALHNVSFSVEKGQSIAFLKVNSADGTCNRILDMIVNNEIGYRDYEFGTIRVRGSIGQLSDVNSMFKLNESGRKNIRLRYSALGIDKIESEVLMDDVETFADIGEQIDEPMKTYQGEMKMRLAFAINANLSRNIFVVDESFKIYEGEFMQKCCHKIKEFVNDGGVFMLFTDSLDIAKGFCSRGIICKNGRIILDDDIDEAIVLYKEIQGYGD